MVRKYLDPEMDFTGMGPQISEWSSAKGVLVVWYGMRIPWVNWDVVLQLVCSAGTACRGNRCDRWVVTA